MLCNQRFRVVVVLVDMKFKCLKDRIRIGAPENSFSKVGYVKQTERFHRLIKERARHYCDMLPFNALPRMMVVCLMMTVVFFINAFAWTDGVSKFLSPLVIVEGVAEDFHLNFRIMLGASKHMKAIGVT